MSSSLIERFQHHITTTIMNHLPNSFETLYATANVKLNDQTANLQSIILSHDCLIKKMAKAFIMLDKARRITKEQNNIMNDKQIVFLESLIQFHSGNTRLWNNNDITYDTLLLELLDVLNQTIKYYDLHDDETLHHLWNIAKEVYPKETNQIIYLR